MSLVNPYPPEDPQDPYLDRDIEAEHDTSLDLPEPEPSDCSHEHVTVAAITEGDFAGDLVILCLDCELVIGEPAARQVAA